MEERRIFLELLDLRDSAERADRLRTATAGDPELHQRMLALLERHDSAAVGPDTESLPSVTPAREPCALLATALYPGDTHRPASLQTSGQAASDGAVRPATRFSFLAPPGDGGGLGRKGMYEVLSVRGRGGMGIVLEARDTQLDRQVALKFLAPELAVDELARKRFLREARSAAAVTHAHIVAIHAVHDEPVPWLVMELVDGQTLADRLESVGSLGVREILAIGSQVASALAAAHAAGLVHRDVKPSNILLQRGYTSPGVFPEVKLTDFGLARAAAVGVEITRSGYIAGTPAYMSPEQALGRPLDPRSDLFSLGSVLYAMCTGLAPYRGESAVAVVRSVVDEPHQPIAELNPEIPGWLIQIVDKLLAKQPEQRFQTAAELGRELQQALAAIESGRGVVDSPAPTVSIATGPPSATAPTRRRSRTWLATGTLAAIALAGIVIKITRPDGTTIEVPGEPGTKVSVEGSNGKPLATFTVPPQPPTPAAPEPTITDPNVLALIGRSSEWTWTEPELLGNGINSDNNDSQPHLTPDGLELWFHTSRASSTPGHKIYRTTRASVDAPFPEPTLVPPPINLDTVDYRDASSPRLTADGLDCVFVSIREGSVGHMDVWMTHRDNVDTAFQPPVNLGETVNSSTMELSPAISGDGLTLIYSAFGRTEAGWTDLYETRRAARDQPFGPSVNLGALVNSPQGEAGAWLSLDGRVLVYRSFRDGDICQLFVTTRPSLDAPFHAPVKLAVPFNCGISGVQEDGFAASADWGTVVFASNRPGGTGMQDLWITRRVAKRPN